MSDQLVGICGATSTAILGNPPHICDLPAGHAGWHGADNVVSRLMPLPTRTSWSDGRNAEAELLAEVAALRRQLAEARGQLRQALDYAESAQLITAKAISQRDAAEADNARLLDVYRAAEAVVAQDIFVFPSAGDQPTETDRAEQAALDALAAKVDAYRVGTPAEAPDGGRA